jgi:L-erythro-3,5-diaminohexanoate dehydrogenase
LSVPNERDEAIFLFLKVEANMENFDPGIKYGTHRVVEPKGCLPQAAKVLDNSLPIHPTEVLISVEVLNIDSASFTQMKQASGGDPDGIKEIIMKTVKERGKQHNPVTGSGGMLTGVVREIGSAYKGSLDAKVGDRIATLVSLSLTPLHLDEILRVHLEREQVEVRGYAILFESGIAVRIPDDFSRDAALAVLDVAGAPAQAFRLVKEGMDVGIIGAGKSGLLCAGVAKRVLKGTGKVYVVARRKESLRLFEELGYVDCGILADATEPVKVFEEVYKATNGKLLDVTMNTTNIPGTEMSTVLATKDGGIAYFFNMATSFTAAALGAEGIGKDVTLLIGNGYVPNHANISLDFVRSEPKLKDYFERKYGAK